LFLKKALLSYPVVFAILILLRQKRAQPAVYGFFALYQKGDIV